MTLSPEDRLCTDCVSIGKRLLSNLNLESISKAVVLTNDLFPVCTMSGVDQTSQTRSSRPLTHAVYDDSSERTSDGSTHNDYILDDLEKRMDFLESLIQIIISRQQATSRWVKSQSIEAWVESTLPSSVSREQVSQPEAEYVVSTGTEG